jgi:hypothetical protein
MGGGMEAVSKPSCVACVFSVNQQTHTNFAKVKQNHIYFLHTETTDDFASTDSTLALSDGHRQAWHDWTRFSGMAHTRAWMTTRFQCTTLRRIFVNKLFQNGQLMQDLISVPPSRKTAQRERCRVRHQVLTMLAAMLQSNQPPRTQAPHALQCQ